MKLERIADLLDNLTEKYLFKQQITCVNVGTIEEALILFIKVY